MSLHKDIEKATSLNWANNDAKFVRLQGLSQAAKDRKMNDRKVKKPRNLHLLEDNNNDSSDDDSDNFMFKTKPVFDEHAISAAIKEVNGGIDLSNKHLEKYWSEQTLRAVKDSTKEEKSQNSRCNDGKEYFENQSEDLGNKDINTQLHKLRKNAAIMGIVNIKKISLEDLICSSNKNLTEEKNKGEGLYEVSTNDLMDNDDNDDNYDSDYVESVPHDEEEGVFIHPLQKGIDTKAYKDVDFTLPRLGKKTKITPKSYFLSTATDDACFGFIKKKSTT